MTRVIAGRWLWPLATGVAFAPAFACATENGTTAFPNGGEDFLVAAMPPPGWYGMLYLNRYSAAEVLDGSGHIAVPGFDLRVHAVTPRLDWVKPVSVCSVQIDGERCW